MQLAKVEVASRGLLPSRKVGPFLKWAGGKRWLTESYPELFPEKFGTYFEPFLGSGAVFFHLQPTSSVLSDVNSSLIETFKTVAEYPDQILDRLVEHEKLHSARHYYDVRPEKSDDSIKNASNFIYLNRVCWNGLYRVNLRGEFNVPIGTKTKVVLPSDNFYAASLRLRRAEILLTDFESVIEKSKQDDFIFVDPPYTVRHDNNGFVKYNENIFRWQDQCRLRQVLGEASARGVKILVTNANHDSIRELYFGFGHIASLKRKSVIAGNVPSRGPAIELAIRNF